MKPYNKGVEHPKKKKKTSMGDVLRSIYRVWQGIVDLHQLITTVNELRQAAWYMVHALLDKI